MIGVFIHGILSQNKDIKDFSIKHIKEEREMIGMNLFAILKIEDTDSPELIQMAKLRMFSRFRTEITWLGGEVEVNHYKMRRVEC